MGKRVFLLALSCCLLVGSALGAPQSLPATRRVILLLDGPPVSAVAAREPGLSLYKGLARNSKRAKRLLDYRAGLERKQDDFAKRLRALCPSVRIGRRFTGLINGLAMEMPAGLEAKVRSWPEVLGIAPTRKYRPFLNASNPLMGVSEAWQKAGGDETAGRGIKIGMLDTGIDHTHVMFDDTGYELPEGFPLGEAEFTNKKIIVARAFPSIDNATQDATPRDRAGHGTHTAACAAGGLNTPSPLGPLSGIAPNAYLGNYKVFTAEFAETDQLVAGLEACVEDGMDIVNMSFGGEGEYLETPLDPEAIAIRNAIVSGVIVVAAAGNEGKTESISSPGLIPGAITVGSVSNGHSGRSSADRNEALMNVYADGKQILNQVDVLLAEDPDFLSRPIMGRFCLIDADLVDGGSYGGETDGLICEDLPGGSAERKWVLAQRGVCTFSSKIDRIQAAGGWGALIYNSATPPEPEEEFDPDLPVQFPSVPGTQIPAYFVGRGDGLEVKRAFLEHDKIEIEFVAPTVTEQEQTPFQISSFSSLGPTVDYAIKPELVAVGEWSYAAVQDDAPLGVDTINMFHISGFDFMSGTSGSTPRVAGAAALVKQAHPTWDPERIKSALVITADRPSPLDTLTAMTRGGGHPSVDEAVDVPLLAVPSTLSFCRQMVAEHTRAEHSFTLENVSSGDQSLSLSVSVRANAGMLDSSSVKPNELVLKPGGRKEVTVALVFDPPFALSDEVDIDGDVVLSVASLDEPLRVPFWVRVVRVPKPEGTVLLIDDDNEIGSEGWYEAAVQRAGYNFTTWDRLRMGQYPSRHYMANFRTVVWFTATTSLNEVSNTQGEERFRTELNGRVRFNTELTRYLAQGGSLLISGQDWSDAQEEVPFAQHVLHITYFGHDPYAGYQPGRGDQQVERLNIFGLSDNPVGHGIGNEFLDFDEEFEDYVDIVIVDNSGYAKPAFRTNEEPVGVNFPGDFENDVGVTVEACGYRAVFLAFPLERLSEEAMSQIMSNSLSWLGSTQPESLSILSIDPSSQPDTNSPVTVVLTVTGVNFAVGNQVGLDDINLLETSFKECGQLEAVIPAGLPNGLYDVTVRTPDGQVATVPNVFKVGEGDVPTRIAEWELH